MLVRGFLYTIYTDLKLTQGQQTPSELMKKIDLEVEEKENQFMIVHLVACFPFSCGIKTCLLCYMFCLFFYDICGMVYMLLAIA